MILAGSQTKQGYLDRGPVNEIGQGIGCEQKAPIKLATTRLETALTNLSDMADALNDKLAPVLGSGTPVNNMASSQCEALAGDSMVRGILDEAAFRANNIRDRLRELLDRIEL